jgi:thiol-disulfide isomerase/thioredoxin
MRHSATALFCASLLLAACGARQQAAPAAPAGAAPSAASPARHADASGIRWFNGDLDAAFAAARTEHKPVFLYWGAIWCPPCHQIKATVFTRPDFIEKTKQFIAVYLDGDDPGAQKAADQFNVTGYPTLVVLNDKREEITRIASGMDLSLYANVLDLALGEVQPAGAVLAAAAGGRRLTDSECRQLAYTAWGLEYPEPETYGAQGQRLHAAAAQCPAALRKESARLEYIAAGYMADAELAALKGGTAPSKALQQQVATVYSLLADADTGAANADVMAYLSENFYLAAKASQKPTAAEFYQRFAAATDEAVKRPEFTEADHLLSIASRLQAAKVLNGSIDPTLALAARARVDAALAGKQIPYVRSAIINSVLWIFDIQGQTEAAYRVVKGEVANSETAYYYKADLADLAEQLGRKDEALEWARQAYAESQGTATRFQWGRLYLTALMRLKPDDTSTIRSVGIQVLKELDGTDRIYRRARTRLIQLDGDLRKWSAAAAPARTPVLRALRQQLQGTCTRIPAAEPARASCDAFLAGAA